MDIKSLLEKAVSATTSDEILDIFDQMLTVAGLGEVDIRSLLFGVDDLLSLHQRKLEKLQQIKKALLEQMFC